MTQAHASPTTTTTSWRLHNAWWVHMPAVGSVCLFAVGCVMAWPWPATMPVHYGPGGQADRWGSPWEIVLLNAVAAAILLGLQVAIGEGWARRESRKRFNFLLVLLTAVIAGLMGLGADMMLALARGGPALTVPWRLPLALAGALALFAAVLEFLRPARPIPGPAATDDPVAPELAALIARGQRWSYWESQHPFWLDLVCVGAVLLLLVTATIVDGWLTRLLVLWPVPLAILPFGGVRVSVTPDRLRVRAGLIRVINLTFPQIASAEVHEFSPLADFGGWGIRWKPGVLGVFFRGHRGVRIRTTAGKTYVIGSDTPERLAAVLHAAAGQPAAAT